MYYIKAGNDGIPSVYPDGNHAYPINKSFPLNCLHSMAIFNGEIMNEDKMNFIFTKVFDEVFPRHMPEPEDLYTVKNFSPFPSRKHGCIIMLEILNTDSIIMHPSTYMSQMQFALTNSICDDIGHDIIQVAAIVYNNFNPHSSLKPCSAGASLDAFNSVDQFNIRKYKTWEQTGQAH